jgi:hypothetical protein
MKIASGLDESSNSSLVFIPNVEKLQKQFEKKSKKKTNSK